MKTLQISNGEIRKGYELSDLPEEAKERVLDNHLEFLMSIAETDEEENAIRISDVEESLKINEYLFDEEGEFLPIRYHTVKNEVVKITYGTKEYDVRFI